MQIDWFTLIAQIVNFMILVYLLKRFLYGPIIRAMDKRQEEINSRLSEAERERERAKQEAAHYQQQRQELEATREHMLADARRDVEAQRKELLNEARIEVENTQRRWQEAIQRDRESFLRELRQAATEQLMEIVRLALRDMADAGMEERMVDVFTRRLRELDAGDKETIAEAIREHGGEVEIRSAFELPRDIRDNLTSIAGKHFADGGKLHAHFETSPELVSGIELQVGGYRIGWSIESYLEALEERLVQALDEETGQESVRGHVENERSS
ncbi:MAG: F0F1 ATP synthase subunit B [Chloroflexota bacterium]